MEVFELLYYLDFLKSTVITEKSFVFGEYSTLFLLKIHFIPKI